MRLMKPSPGEAYDRITILSLKIQAAQGRGLLTSKAVFEEEHSALVDYMIEKHYTVPTGLGDEMFKINSRLWDLEDQQREILARITDPLRCEEPYAYSFLNNAITVLRLNDARAETVQKINAACGVNAPEKLHYVKESQIANADQDHSG